MIIKKDLQISTDDFFYDLFVGGYLNPKEILENENEIESVMSAIKIINEFRKSCEENIEEFYI